MTALHRVWAATLAAAAMLAACGSPSQAPATVALKFDPAAARGGDFAVDATDTDAGPCIVPDGIQRLRVLQFGTFVTNTSQVDYRLSALDRNCTVGIVIPTGAELRLTIEGFRDDNDASLVRKGIVDLGLIVADAALTVTAPMWPASRLNDQDAADNASRPAEPNLTHVDIIRRLDRFTFELVFAGAVQPATQRGSTSVAGSMRIAGPDGAYLVLFDSQSDGMPLVPEANTLTGDKVPFQFESDRMRIQVPYAAIVDNVAVGSDGVVDAPDVEIEVSLVNNDGSPGDRLDVSAAAESDPPPASDAASNGR